MYKLAVRGNANASVVLEGASPLDHSNTEAAGTFQIYQVQLSIANSSTKFKEYVTLVPVHCRQQHLGSMREAADTTYSLRSVYT